MAETKPATIFDFINGVTSHKKEWSDWSESDQKKFAPFIVNRWLSMRMELTEFINELQRYTIGTLAPREVYKLYYDLLPNTKSFAKYIKGSKSDKYDAKLIKQVAEHYQTSLSEATEYVELMDRSSCITLLQKYGYAEKEIKQMVKGLK